MESIKSWETANTVMLELSGINSFFALPDEFDIFLHHLEPREIISEDIHRREYGDFQTPLNLSKQICQYVLSDGRQPKVLIEPTFGKGSFILSALQTFPSIRQVFGVEIYGPYYWQTKFALLEYFIENPERVRPRINLFVDDVFQFNFKRIVCRKDEEILVLGNPPWVTNSELSSLNSGNVPRKSNFKSFNGLDAITGKGNFDIGEYIILMMLDVFANRNGTLSMLAKNSVVKNVVHNLPESGYAISNIQSLLIDAKFHFNASVEASLFRCNFGGKKNEIECNVATMEFPNIIERKFGWTDKKFVSDMVLYQSTRQFDGMCPFEWRQGVKHDCSKIIELTFEDGKYKNGFDELVDIEDDLIFPLVKSSDIQNLPTAIPRKYVIITQKRVGEDTSQFSMLYPRLYRYLSQNRKYFDDRKSSIYNGKSPFAIFGIGDYSFKPFKVAISGLYKKPVFALVPPYHEKPMMLDDTCYFIGFEEEVMALFTLFILNSELVQTFLASITFVDSKRPYTKDVLMRIEMKKVAEQIGFKAVLKQLEENKNKLLPFVTQEKWEAFLMECNVESSQANQISLFEQASTVTVPEAELLAI